MWFRTWFQSRPTPLSARRQRPAKDRQSLASRHLRLEFLEDRRVMAFVPAVSYPVGANPDAAIVADFNNDGRPDLATANYSSNSVSVLLGNAGGTFQPAVTSPAGTGPRSVAVGDFDGDGKLD